MEISVKLIKELRMKTGSGLMECKTALQKSSGDLIKAIDYLRTVGISIAEDKTLRITKFGRVFFYTNENTGILLEVNSETDFVEKNDDFKNFGQKIVDFSGTHQIFDINRLNSIFEMEKKSLIAKFRENIVIKRIQSVTGDVISSYIHLGKIGVIISGKCLSVFKNQKKCFKFIAMHIAALNPLYLTESEIPHKILKREKTVQKKIADRTGKNKYVLDAIISGRMNKFMDKIVLLRQNFVINPKITISEYLQQNKVSINSFVRFQVGEDI